MNIRTAIADTSAAIERLLASNPELNEDERLRADMFEGETDFNNLVSRLLHEIETSRVMVQGIGDRKQALSARQDRYERKIAVMRDLIASLMEKAALKTIVLPEATISYRFTPPSPVIVCLDDVPDDCIRVRRYADMASINTKISAGETVPGTTMDNGHSSITIRVK